MTTEETSTIEPAPTKTYVVHGIMRNVAHRTHRAQSAKHLGRKVYVGARQTRLVPGQRLHISEEVFLRDLEDLRAKAAMHVLEVRTTDGRLVDLTTLEPGVPAPAVVRPHPKLDSVADDKQVGQYIPPYVGDDTAMPQVLKPGEKPDLLLQGAIEFTTPETTDAPEAPADAPTTSAVDAAVEAAQADAAADEPPTAHTEQKTVSSGESQSRKKRSR